MSALRPASLLLAAAALVGALALPATAQAQAAGVLVSNIGQTTGGYLALNEDYLRAQAFSVPSDGGEYTLTSIEILINADIPSTERMGGRLEAGPGESGHGTTVACLIPYDADRGGV